MTSSSISAGPSADSGSLSADLSSLPTEASLIGRFVAILTPVFAIAAGWIAGLVAQAVPGAHLDQDQVVTFMAAAAAAALAAGWKWLHGWQQHEALVARGLDVPVKQGQSPQAALAAGTPPAPPVSTAPPRHPRRPARGPVSTRKSGAGLCGNRREMRT